MIRMQGTLNKSAASFPSRAGTMDGVRVLLVEGVEHDREALVAELSERGFVVQAIADATGLLSWIDNAVDADVIVLEWELSTTSGVDLLLLLRERGVNLPVAFLTSQTQQANEQLAFERGAVDFIDKARGAEILASRLRLLSGSGQRIPAVQGDKPVVCGNLVLRPESNRAYWHGTDVGLTVGEYKIAHLLASNVGSHVTYRAIYDRLTYEGFIAGIGDIGYRTNVRSAIKKVRNKFRVCDPAFAEIENFIGVGYCWTKSAARAR
jgi:two-component system, OmpR family, response regulator ChvI